MQKNITLSNIIKNKNENIKNQISANMNYMSIKILKLFERNVNYGADYIDGQGISPEDQYPRAGIATTMLKDSWRKYKNNSISENSIGYVFRNDAKHAKYLLGRESSTGTSLRGSDNAKFRSAKRHRPAYYLGQKVTRANQLTSKKWNQFLVYVKKLMKEGALSGITTK